MGNSRSRPEVGPRAAKPNRWGIRCPGRRFATSGVLLRADGEDGRHVHSLTEGAPHDHRQRRGLRRRPAGHGGRVRTRRYPPPEHYHPTQEETFTGLSGTVTARIGGVERTIRPGEMVTIPAGTKHAFWNPDTEPATIKWEVRPALSTERMFEELSHAGSTFKQALVISRYKREFRLSNAPGAASRRSSVSSRRLWGAHSSVVTDTVTTTQSTRLSEPWLTTRPMSGQPTPAFEIASARRGSP